MSESGGGKRTRSAAGRTGHFCSLEKRSRWKAESRPKEAGDGGEEEKQTPPLPRRERKAISVKWSSGVLLVISHFYERFTFLALSLPERRVLVGTRQRFGCILQRELRERERKREK